MTFHELTTFAPLLALLTWAAVGDVLTRRIPNWLTFGLVVSGVACSFATFAWLTPGQALAGLGVGFGLTFGLFCLGALGGGDVKLMAGVGAWLGAKPVLVVFALAALVGLVIVLVQALWQRRMGVLVRNSTVLAINLVHLNEVGADHVTETGRTTRSVDKPLPYAVPVLVAVLVVLRMG